MLGGFEDHAAIGALALEHARGIVEGMRQDVDLGLLPGNEVPVIPDPTVALIEGGCRHRSLLVSTRFRLRDRP
jgi:hypothetical protein